MTKAEKKLAGIAVDAYREHRAGYGAAESIHYAAQRINQTPIYTAHLLGFTEDRYPTLFAKL